MFYAKARHTGTSTPVKIPILITPPPPRIHTGLARKPINLPKKPQPPLSDHDP